MAQSATGPGQCQGICGFNLAHFEGQRVARGGMPISGDVDCALSLDLFLLKRFLSLSPFLLFDEPQPRKTSGGDHHHGENDVVSHRSCPELMLTDQDAQRKKAARTSFGHSCGTSAIGRTITNATNGVPTLIHINSLGPFLQAC
jgi:hypothetical protein